MRYYPFKGELLSMTEHSWKQHSEHRNGADAKRLDRSECVHLGGREPGESRVLTRLSRRKGKAPQPNLKDAQNKLP